MFNPILNHIECAFEGNNVAEEDKDKLKKKLYEVVQAIDNDQLDTIRSILKENPILPELTFFDYRPKPTKTDLILNAVQAIDNDQVDKIRSILEENPILLELTSIDTPPKTHLILNVLGYAASRCKIDVINVLCDEFKVDPNQHTYVSSNQYKPAHPAYTPLHQVVLADQKGYNPASDIYKTAEHLISKGANPDLKVGLDGSRQSARDFAEKTAPSVLGLARNGSNAPTQGANCLAVFSKNDTPFVTFAYQLSRNTPPIKEAVTDVAKKLRFI